MALAKSLQPLQALATKLHVQTDTGNYDLDPAQDPSAYADVLGQSADRRRRLDNAQSDAAFSAAGPDGTRGQLMSQFGRAQAEGANGPAGWNRQWTPFFESMNVLGDNSGKNYELDARTLDTPTAPSAGLPPGYTDDRYNTELNTFAGGGAAPGFASTDTRGFPEIGQRFQTEMKKRAASMAALAKQGGC
jgi:hypothetical protein